MRQLRTAQTNKFFKAIRECLFHHSIRILVILPANYNTLKLQPFLSHQFADPIGRAV